MTTITITFAAPRDVLVASSIPGANEALTAGHAARDALWRAGYMTTERKRREARPLPAEGTRERGWALENRARYADECEQAGHKAAALAEQYARRLATVRGKSPATADAVEAATGRNPR
jgi:hypothetical protein